MGFDSDDGFGVVVGLLGEFLDLVLELFATRFGLWVLVFVVTAGLLYFSLR